MIKIYQIMNIKPNRLCLFLALFLIIVGSNAVHSKEKLIETKSGTDPSNPVVFTPPSASEYILKLLEEDNMWRKTGDTMKLSLTRLISQYNEPFDSVKSRLWGFDYNAVQFRLTDIVTTDTLPVRWLIKSRFIIDTVKLEKNPVIVTENITERIERFVGEMVIDSITGLPTPVEPLVISDTVRETFIDSLYLEKRNIQLHRVVNSSIDPPVVTPESNKRAAFSSDSTKLIISESFRVIMGNPESPFYIVPHERVTDSLKVAVETLLTYTETRDSVLLYVNTSEKQRSPFWLTTREEDPRRIWVKNDANDSITVWMGNPSKYNLTLALEDNIQVERRLKKSADDIPITTLRPQRTIASLKPLDEIPVYWKYGLISSFTLNQTYHSNWAKGGQNSLAGMLDIRGSANYKNTENKREWTNNGRMRYGAIITEEHGFRTNTDIIEVNSQYNRVLTNKIDFSSSFYGKTQAAKGYNYPNDSVPVSKFFNPGTFTVGVGIEYKPFKDTRLNFSPLSYRNTFVLDTANIDQTKHGVDRDKRARQEMGGQLVVRNSITVLEDLKITNSVRLFSSYLDKPQNVDVDWEVSFDMQINWYFTVRLNLHLIYDDDIRFPLLDSENNPVMNPDGTPRRVAKAQLKQFLGLTMSIRL
jgi:hypothetical protein